MSDPTAIRRTENDLFIVGSFSFRICELPWNGIFRVIRWDKRCHGAVGKHAYLKQPALFRPVARRHQQVTTAGPSSLRYDALARSN